MRNRVYNEKKGSLCRTEFIVQNCIRCENMRWYDGLRHIIRNSFEYDNIIITTAGSILHRVYGERA